MGFLLPKGIVWMPANWISIGFFEDAAANLEEAPHLADKIRFCLQAEVDTIDLETATTEELEELQSLTQKVIAGNLEREGTNFHQPQLFPVYFDHIKNLNELIGKALQPDG